MASERPIRRDRILAGVPVVILAGAAVIWYVRMDDGRPTEGFRVYGVSLATGEDIERFYPRGAAEPFEDPATGERAVYYWYYNPNTKMLLIPELRARDGVWVVVPNPVDPRTGDPVAPYVPDMPDMEVVGRQPLPPWPPDAAER